MEELIRKLAWGRFESEPSMEDKQTTISRSRSTPRIVWIALVLIAAFAFFIGINRLSAMNSAPGGPLPYGQSGYWQMVFNDEFDSQQLDSQKWVKCYWWDRNGCTNEGNHELEWYLPENISIQGGALQLTAKQEQVQGSNGKTYPFSSGMVTTGRDVDNTELPPRFALIYGYVEARVRVPKGQGLWPAIWMLPTTHQSRPEIDIMEILGHDPGTVHMNYHYTDPQGTRMRSDGQWNGGDLSGDWHVFAIDWKPGAIDWYIDGKKVRSYIDPEQVPSEPLYLLINLAVGGDWGGPPDESTPFPSSFEIDYVRVWKPGSSAALTPTADTYVDGSAPGQNFGSAAALSVDGSPQDNAFLKFDLKSLANRKISSAWLRVKTTDETGSGSQSSQTVHLVQPDQWEESTLAPPVDLQIDPTSLGSLASSEMNTVYDIPLDAALLQSKVGGMLSLAIMSDYDNGISIYSRESPGDAPRLMIVTEENPILHFIQKYWNDVFH